MKIKGLKPGAKFVLLAILGVVGFFAVKTFYLDAPREVGESKQVADISVASDMEIRNPSLPKDKELALPSFDVSKKPGLVEVDWVVIPWNSQLGLMYANGGPVTTEGSLFEKYGLKVNIKRQDDCLKTMSDFIANAAELQSGNTKRPMIASFMGDGLPGFSIALQKMPQGDKPVMFYTMGRSNGEDQFMGPKEWVTSPKACLGKTVAGVKLDGDMNIVLKWASDNDIPVNVDNTTYDSSALNVIYTSDFMEPVRKYESGYTEEKIVKSKGKTTKQTVKVGVDAVTTWTPGDVAAHEAAIKIGKPLVTIASTADYSGQMPNAAIISNRWATANAEVMTKIILALGEAGDQVRSFPRALLRAGDISAKVYGENNGDYWIKYYKGVKVNDDLQLGGSSVFNLADAANVMGLGSDGVDRYQITYNSFAKVLKDLYPQDMANFTPYDNIVDKTYLRAALANGSVPRGEATKNTYTGDITHEVSRKAWKIQFANNSDVISPESNKVLDEIFKSVIVAEALKISVQGHANNTPGTSEDYNQDLSSRRARAVVNALVSRGITAERVEGIGYGTMRPLPGVPDSHDSNRRVEIVLGKN